MVANVGRDLLLKTGSTVLAGLRTKGVAVNGEPIDITTDDSSGFRELLDEAGTMSLDISVDGITQDNELRQAILTNNSLTLSDVNLEYPNGDTLSGTFLLTSFEESSPYQDAITFTATLMSSGQWTYTPA